MWCMRDFYLLLGLTKPKAALWKPIFVSTCLIPTRFVFILNILFQLYSRVVLKWILHGFYYTFFVNIPLIEGIIWTIELCMHVVSNIANPFEYYRNFGDFHWYAKIVSNSFIPFSYFYVYLCAYLLFWLSFF